MNAVAPVSHGTLEHVLATGDLSRLSSQQRLEYLQAVCKSTGLNPLTRPIRFLRLGNEVQAYFTRDGTDQLRKIHQISLNVVEQRTEGDVLTVRVKARMPNGREDEDIGAVSVPRNGGDSKANAAMKAVTKAKRRVTLSICGLGFMSEDELDTVPGAQVLPDEPAPSPAPTHAPSENAKLLADDIPDFEQARYPFETRNGVRYIATGPEFLETWRRLAEQCRKAGILDKLRTARDLNERHFTAVAELDAELAQEVREMIAAELGEAEPAEATQEAEMSLP